MHIPQILHKLLDYSPHFESKRRSGNIIYTVAGPDLQIRWGDGGGGGRSDSEISGGAGAVSEFFFGSSDLSLV